MSPIINTKHRTLAKTNTLKTTIATLGFAIMAATSISATAAPELPTTLKGVAVPETPNLYEFINDKPAAIALGKALFWDERVGSDGETSCATCHFSAGTDNRIKNTIGPAFSKSGSFHSKKPNQTLKIADFPFTKFSTVTKNDTTENQPALRDVRDVVSSQGVFLEDFVDAIPGKDIDETVVVGDSLYNVNGYNTNRVQLRNTPTMINAIFNLRNALDGRALTALNNVNAYENINGALQTTKPVLDMPLGRQALAPILDNLEMTARGRTIPDIGKRIIPLRMLAGQKVALDDSALGPYANANGDGLPYTYDEAIKYIFKEKFWSSNQKVSINGKEYSQVEANFPLFWAIAVALYEAELVSDDSPFDRYIAGDANAMSASAQRGFGLFIGKAKCVNCHSGPLLTDAAITREEYFSGKTKRIERILMADGGTALHDVGFHNIAVTRDADDIGLGRVSSGIPLSFSKLAQTGRDNFFNVMLDYPNLSVDPNERVAVDGAFKTPGLRNVALTAPYFHNGGYATLRSVVEFYNRGGNFPKENAANLDANYAGPLGLNDQEMDDLVSFMEALTDPRVAKHAAPFDHPSLIVTNGHTGNEVYVKPNPLKDNTAEEDNVIIPAVGKNGYSYNAVPTFLERIGGDHHARADNPDAPIIKDKWVRCASEGGICKFRTAKEVRIVVNGLVGPKIWYGNTAWCLRHMFGLPYKPPSDGVCEVKE